MEPFADLNQCMYQYGLQALENVVLKAEIRLCQDALVQMFKEAGSLHPSLFGVIDQYRPMIDNWCGVDAFTSLSGAPELIPPNGDQ